MKLRLPHLLRRLLIAAMTVTGVTVGTSNTQAGVMHEDISIMTYTDFGQNMGRYTTTTNALLNYIRQRDGGIVITYTGGQDPYTISNEQGMISYESQTDNGAAAAVGYSYLGTVEHNGEIDASFGSRYLGWDNCVKYSAIEYRYIGEYRNVPNTDYKVTRQSKIITDVTPSTLFTGDVTTLGGTLMYRAGAGDMYIRDAEGNQPHVMEGYNYIIGGINNIDGIWYNDDNHLSYSGEWTVDFSATGLTENPLANALGAGDSGSPVWIYNSATKQYEYLMASQAGSVTTYSIARGAGEYSQQVIDDDTVAVNTSSTTLYINQVSDTAASTVTAGEIESFIWQGTITDGTNTVATFNGVKNGVNTWADLSGLKDQQNWYGYGEDYLNAVWSNPTDAKPLTFADLFHTNNVLFGTTTVDDVVTPTTNTAYNIILTDTVDLGVGYAQFVGSGNTFTITSEGEENNQFNHAGYVVEAGATVHLQLTNPADYMYEWRKTGAGDLYIDGEGDTNALLNLGGAGKTYLQQTGGHAAYNVLANNGTYVSIKDAAQIDRDFTFGLGGATLDLNGVSMEWYYTAETADNLDDTRFSINALTEEAIIANSSSTASILTFKESGNQTFLGSFRDTETGALNIVYDVADGTWTLHSIWTDLSNHADSGLSVAQGKVILVGTHTKHAIGSAGATTTNRYSSELDWHYADAKMNVSVASGATFELGSHARLTGNVTVADGGTFIMREGVQHAQEYIEGGQTLENTENIAAYYGLKGNVTLQSGATMQVAYNSGVTANNTYSGNITGAGNVSIDLGHKKAHFTLAGTNTFSGTKTLTQGFLTATNTAALGDTTTNKWVINEDAVLAVESGLTFENALGYIDSASSGSLALTEDMTDVLDMSGHSTLFIGALEGMTVQYGTADDTLTTTADSKWNLGGGGGELVVNAQLTGGSLVLGNGSNEGIVTLTNTNNQIDSITFNGGVVLNISDNDALGGATITLGYNSAMMTDSDTTGLLNLVTTDSQGAIMLDHAENAAIDLSGHTAVALGSYNTTEYSGAITVAADGTYRFGGARGKLVLTNALAVNGTNALVVDGQTTSGGVLQLNAATAITGQVSVMGYDATKTSATTGDMTLTFGVDNALANVSGVKVNAGGILDVGSTTQTLKDVQVNAGGLLKGNADGTLIFNMTVDGLRQEGAMQLGKAEKIGSGTLLLSVSGNTWDLLTIKEGKVFTQVNNALSETGITRVENGGELNLNTWNGDGFRGRTMGGHIELGDGGVVSVGTIVNEAVNTVTFNGTISVDKGATGTINGGYWYVTGAANNEDGGTLAFNASALHLDQTYAQSFGGTFDIASSGVTMYSGGSGSNMLKHFNHLDVDSGKTLTVEDATWNTIWQMDKLTGAGTITWNSDTTHDYTARMLLSGDGAFSGTINFNRNYGAAGRTHQAFLEISSETAATGAVLNMDGNANSYATLALNADSVRLGGVSGDEYSHIMAGAAPAASASTEAPASTRAANLILTGSGTYTYSGSIGNAADTAATAVSLTMEGSGIQTISGTTVVLNDVAALSGTLQVSATNFTLLGDATVKQGATLKLGDAFTLSSGHTLHVQGSDSADTATFGSAITFDSGVLSFDASDLSTSSGTYSLSVGTATGTGTINFENTGSLDMGTYYLASGDWSGAKLTLDASLSYLQAAINNTASGLSITLSLGAGSNIWNGTDSANSWTADTFGSIAATMTGTAVFNDDAANKTVAVSGNQNLTNLRFDSTGAYQLNVGEGASVAADNLYQVGSGSTTLSGSVSIGTATQIDAGSLVVTGTNQSLGTISGEGELVIDWGASGSGSLTITELGTLNVQSGSYGDSAATTAVNAKNIIVGSGATYLHGSGSYTGHITSEGGTITTHGGSLNGTMTMVADTTLNVAEDTHFNATLTQNAGQLIKTGSGTLILNGSATGVVLQDMAVQAGTLEYESGTFSAGVLNIDAGATLRVDNSGNLVANTINLSGTLHMENGSGNYIDADIVTSDGAIIRGTSWGSGSVVNGTLKGEGKLTLMGVNPWNKYTVNSLISDAEGKQLAVEFDGQPAWASDGSDVAVTFAGANTYSGGTTITFGTLNTSSQTALGSGAVSMNGGKLSLNSNLTVSSVSNTDAGLTGTINLNGNTLTVDGNVTATYAAVLTGGSIAKVGSGTQTFSQATALQNISVSEGTLNLTADSVSGSIEVTGGELALASSYTLGEGQSLLVGSSTSLGGLTLGGGVIMLDGTSLQEATALLSTGTVTGDVATTILLAGGMPNVAGTYMLASGNWDGINTANIAVAAQQTYAARSGAASEFESSLTANADGLYLTLDEIVTDSNIWAPTVADSDDTWSSTSFSQYGTGAVGADATAIFNADAIDKSVRVTEAVSIGGMEITGGGYSFSGSQISTGTLSVSGGGDASSIDNVNVSGTEDGTITVDGSELTIVQLTPANPSAPIALSNEAKLTIGSADYRYGSFSGKVTGDAGSQLHLYTTQVSDSYWNEDGRVHLLTDSTVQDVYIHGDLALNLFTNDSNQTNLQAANLHMDAGSNLVIRSSEATLTPTTGDVVMAGDLNLVAYGQVGIDTTLTSDFTLESGATGTLTKTDGGSITLSGTLAVSGVTASSGTLKLTGANTQTMVYTVKSGATLTLAGDSTYSFDASALRTISGTLNVDSTVNVSGTQRITVESGGKLVLGNGASFNRTDGNGGAYWLKGSLEALQDATASFSTEDDVHFYGADGGAINLQSGSTLNMTVKSLQYWKQAEINLGENSILNLFTTHSVYASGSETKKLDINLAAGATLNLNGGDVTLNADSSLTLAAGSAINVNAGTLKTSSTLGVDGETSTITLAGGNLYLNSAADQTVYSKLVVNNTRATADAPTTSILRNDAGSGNRVLSAVQIEANNTLDLQSASGVYTIWQIQDLSGSGNVLWTSHSGNAISSQLVLSGDGSDYTGNITVNRSFDQSSGPYQTYVVLASDNAVKNSVITLNCTSASTKSNARTSLAVHTANALVAGLQSDEYAHLYAGEAITSRGTTAAASTVANTLTITGGDAYTFAGTVGTANDTEHLNLAMDGTGTQTFSGVAHVGDIGVSNGSLVLSNTSSTVSGDITVSGGALDMDATYTLGTGQSLSVLTGTANTVQLGGLTLSGGEMLFDASLLSADSAALSVGSLTLSVDSQVINFTNTENLASGTAYMLASGTEWSGLDMSKFTASGLGNSLYTFSTTDSGGLYLTISGSAMVWAGTDEAHAWNSTSFSTHEASVASQKAVFDGTAANTMVQVTEAVTTGEMLIQGDKQYSFEGAGSVTTDVLTHESTPSVWLYTGLTVNNLISAKDIDVAWGGVLNVNGSGSIEDMTLRANSTASSQVNFRSLSLSVASISLFNTSALNFGLAEGATAAAYTVSGNINVQNNANNTNRTITVAEGATLTVQGTMDGDVGHTLTVNGNMIATALDYSGGTTAVDGSGALTATTTKVSGGTVNLSTAEADLGVVTVNGGALNISSAISATLGSLTTSGSSSVTFASASTTVGDINMQNASSITFNLAAGADATSYTVGAISTTSTDNFQRNINVASGVTVNASGIANGWGMETVDVDGVLNVDGLLEFATGNNTNRITGDGSITVDSAEFGNHGVYDISVHQMTVQNELKLLANWGDRNMTISGGTLTVQGAINMTENDTTRRKLYISGGNLELQNGGTMSGGVLTLSSGALKQQGGNTTISNTFDMTGGSLNVEGGKLTLSSTPTITLAEGATTAVTVSGGTLDLTKENAAVLLGTAGVNFTLSGGILDLADATFTADTVDDAISLASTAGLSLNSGTLALGNLSTGTYYLFNSGAEDVWDHFTAANVTLGGENALRYGATVGYTTVDEVTYATITTTSDTATALTLYWDGGESGTWDATQTVWNVQETLDGGMTDFNDGDDVVFNIGATVDATEAVSADSLTVQNGATVALSGSITANSIGVVSGELSLSGEGISAAAYSVAQGATLKRVATGTDALASTILTTATGAGNIAISGSGKDTTTVKLSSGAISTATGQLILSDLTLDMHTDNALTSTYDLSAFTSMSWDNVLVKYHGQSTTFNDVTVGSNGASLRVQDMNGYDKLITFAGTTSLGGTLDLISNQWKAQIKIAALTGVGDLNIASSTNANSDPIVVTIAAAQGYTGDVTVTKHVKDATLILNESAFGSADSTITLEGGNLQLNNGAAQTIHSTLVVNNSAATADATSTSILRNDMGAESLARTLNSVEIAANNTLELQQESWNTVWTINSLTGEGNLTWKSTTTHSNSSRLIINGDNDFSGNITLSRVVDNVWGNGNWQAFLVLASDTAAKNATVTLMGADSADNAIMAVDTANAQVMGVTGNTYSHIYAGAAKTAVSASDTAPASTADNTLTIAGGDTYTFAGTIGTADETEHLNLAMIGSGKQNFNGVAHVGDITVKAGLLVLSDASSTVSGDVMVNAGGSLTLAALTLGTGQTLSVFTGTADAVSVGALTLSGGVLEFDASLLKTDEAALGLTGALTLADGSAYIVNVGDGAVLTTSGSYMLASGDWSAAAGATFTVNGMEYGSTGTINATADGLFLDYVASAIYTWTGEAGDSTWSTANWDAAGDSGSESVEFVNSTADAITHAVFRTDATVNATNAVSVGTVSIIDAAQVTLGVSGENASFAADTVVVENGKLTIAYDTNMTGISSITVAADGVLELAWGAGINNAGDTNTSIILQSGSVNLMNGRGSYNELEADITVENSGYIHGSVYGNDSVINGSIAGSGDLTFDSLVIPGDGTYRNTITVASTIADGAEGALALHVADADIILSGANTYAGGTSVAESGKLTITNVQAIGGSSNVVGQVLGKLSGEGTFVIALGDTEACVIAKGTGDAANLGAFTGTIDVQSGILRVGNEENTSSLGGADADFKASKVIVGADGQFVAHFGQSTKILATQFELQNGAVWHNIDGHVNVTGDIAFNAEADGLTNADGTVQINSYWGKNLKFGGLLSGAGTVKLENCQATQWDTAVHYYLLNDDNTFSGVYELADGTNSATNKTITLYIDVQNAAQYATINLASTTAVSKLQLDTDATIAALNSTDADNLVTTTGAYTLTVGSGAFAGKLQNGSATNTLSLTKQGSGTLTLSGTNTYTGATTISGGTLELAGAVSMAAESAISVVSGTTLLLNANTQAMVLDNGITGEGTIHKKGAYAVTLTGDIVATDVELKDTGSTGASWENNVNAGELTFTGETVKVGTFHAGYGTINIGGTAEEDATFMQVTRFETGDSNAGGATTANINAGSTLSVTGSNNDGSDYKDASIILGEWNYATNLSVAGKLLAPSANALVGDNSANITISNGGVMAVQGISHAKSSKVDNQIDVTLNDGGTLILGSAGISTDKTFTATLGAGTVGMSAATTTIAEDLTLNSAAGTTFDTTQYSFVTNADGVATDIVRGETAGTMTLSGAISAADAKMNVVGNGTLNVTGAATLGYLDVAAGATASFAGGITDTILVNDQKNPANTVVSGAGKLNLQAGNSKVAANVTLDEFTGRVNVAESANLTANITVEANADGTATKLDGTHDITNTTLNLTLNNGAHLLGDMTEDRTINIDHLNVVGNATFGTGGAIDSQTYKGYQSTFNISMLQGVVNDTLANKLTLVSNSNTAACTIFNVADLGSFYGDIVVSAENTGSNRRVALNLETNSGDTEELLLWYAYSTIELNTKEANSADDKAALGVIYDTMLKGIKGDDTSGVIVAGKITDATFDSTATEHVTLRLGSWTEDEDFESAATIKSKLNLYKQGVNTQTFTGDTTAFDGSVTVEDGELAFGTSSLKTAGTTVGKHSVTTDEDGTITDTAIPQLSYGEGRVTVQANSGENDATLGAAQFSYDSESGMVTISSHTPAEGQEKETITATNSLITIAQGASLTVDSMIISDSSRISGTAAAVATYAARSADSVSELTLTDSTVVLGAGNDSVVGDTTPQTLSSLQPMGGSGEALTLSGTSNVLTITSNALSNLSLAAGSDFLVDFSYLLSVKGLEDVDFIRLYFNNNVTISSDVNMTGLLTGSTGAQYYLTSYYTGGAVADVGSVYFDVRSIPEPTSTTLSILALAGMMLRRRRK